MTGPVEFSSSGERDSHPPLESQLTLPKTKRRSTPYGHCEEKEKYVSAEPNHGPRDPVISTRVLLRVPAMIGEANDFISRTHASEETRLEALRRYEILDTPREEAFDRLTELAAQIFDVPVAFVAFLDADRQWFKSAVGLDRKESSLAASFCTYTIDRGRERTVGFRTARS